MFGMYLRLHLHVSASDRAVIRAARQMVHPMFRNAWMARGERHRFLRQMLAYHRHAQNMAALVA